MIDENALKEQGDLIKSRPEMREYTYRAYMSSGLTNLDGDQKVRLKSESSPYLVETIHGSRLFKQLSSSAYSSSWSRSSVHA